MPIHAFVGHSFASGDNELIRKFLDFFNNVSKMGIGFHWDHAEEAQPKDLSRKVIEKMEGKNLFIGICTSRQSSIDITQLHPFPLLPNYLGSKKTNFQTKISDWILQEIGFSVGRGMSIILLLEDGVATPGGIQGNIEYIPFRRNNPEESFNKILQMLSSLADLPTTKSISESSQTSKTVAETDMISDVPVSESIPVSEWTLDDFGISLSKAVLAKNSAEEEDVYNKFLNSKFAVDQFTVVRLNAFRIYLSIVLKKENRLDELLEILGNNPDNFYVARFVAIVYENYDEFKQAAVYHEKSSLVAPTIETKLAELSNASLAYAKSGDTTEALSHLQQCVSIARQNEQLRRDLLETLSEVSNELNNLEDYKIFTEALLERAPENHSRRFSLALKYGEDSENDAASFHYRILTTKNPNGANWNNLGVALSNLKLLASAVKAYKEAEKLDETLAMSNLAHKYINEGFLDDATQLTNKAILIENYDKAIGDAISGIKETLEKENKEQVKITEAYQKRRQFYIDYSEKYFKDEIQSLPESWSSSTCMLKLSIDGNTLEMVGEFDDPKALPPSWMPTPSFPAASKDTPEKNYIKYIGKINGSSIKFDYWVSKSKMPQTDSDKPKGSGLMIVEDSKQKIRVYEKGLKDDSAFTVMEAT